MGPAGNKIRFCAVVVGEEVVEAAVAEDSLVEFSYFRRILQPA